MANKFISKSIFYLDGIMVKYISKMILVVIIGLVIITSGCTSGQDITPIVKTLPEVQQFLKEHPNAKIIVTYWSKEDAVKFEQEISKQCDKSITPAAMYKAVISEGDLKSIAWIDAEKKTLICSMTEGNGSTIPTPTITATHTPVETTPIITQTSTQTPTLTPAPTSTTTATPTLVPTSAPISLPSSKTMIVGETWNLGNGYSFATTSIDDKAAPKQVWIIFSQNGHKLDDKLMNEGNVYTYGNIFSTKIALIFSITNADGVPVAAVRFDNSILTPPSNPTSTPTPASTTPAPAPVLYELLQNYAISSCYGGDQKNIRVQLIYNGPIYEGSQVNNRVMKEDIVVAEGNDFDLYDSGLVVNGLRITPLIINATFNTLIIGTTSNTVKLSNLVQYDRIPDNVTPIGLQVYTGTKILELGSVDIVLPKNAPCFWN